MTQNPVIIWTAGFDEQNGQAIVTNRVYKTQNVRWLECVYRKGGGGGAVVVYLLTIVRLLIYTIQHRHAPIYVVASRSNFGFLRDLPVLATALFGRKVICHFHGSDVLGLLTESRFSRLAQRLYHNCVLVVPSTHLVDPMADMMGADIIVCENPATLGEATLKEDVSTEASTFPVLIWNSNMLASKGFVDVLWAIAEINAIEHKLDFWALGQPLSDHEMSSDEISSLLAQFDDEPWFYLFGAVSADEAIKLTSRSDIVALPSRYRSECQPLAIIQAMCLGKAVVVSTIPAMKATLKDYPAFFTQNPTLEGARAAILDAVSSIASDSFDAEFVAPFANAARQRFSAERFDRQMSEILSAAARSSNT